MRRRHTVLIAVLALAGCEKDPIPLPTDPQESVASVVVSPTTAEVRVGETATFAVRITSNLGRELTGNSVHWSSGDTLVARVSPAGVATGIAPGTAVAIRATVEGISGEARVDVRRLAETVELLPVSLNLWEGDTARVDARALNHRGEPVLGETLEWSSDAPTVATVDSSGVVSARTPGNTMIRARTLDGAEGTAEVTVVGRTLGSRVVHRWTFSESGGGGTILRDDVGGAEARLMGTGQVQGVVGGGRVTLPGGPWATAGYVELPPRLLSRFQDATIEIWATHNEVRNWARIFDIGNGTTNNIFVTWSQAMNGNSNRSAVTVNGTEYRRDDTLAPFLLGFPHHVVVTIASRDGEGGTTRFSLYLDGEPRGFFDAPLALGDFPDTTAWLGRSFYAADESASASYDELRIHDRTYSPSEVRQLFRQGGVPNTGLRSLEIVPPPGAGNRIRGVGVEFRLRAMGRGTAGHAIVPAGVEWSSSDPGVITIDAGGIARAHREGRVTIGATLENLSASWEVDVVRSRRVPVTDEISTPAPGALWEIPVIMVAYLPTADGVTGDVRKAPDFWWLNPLPLDSIETRCLDFTRRRKMMAEEGSRYRGYKDPDALPSLGYKIVEQLFVYEHAPATSRRYGDSWLVDYDRILRSDGILDRIRDERIREVWYCDSGFSPSFPSFDPSIHDPADARTGWESNMSSPTTGDISNSNRDPHDLPVLDHTYIVYGIAYRRSQAEAMHNVGHQMEAMFSWVNHRQDGNSHLFWRSFVGQNNSNQFITGRAGWTHMPPNTVGNYDYHNPTPVPSDIEDWRPDGTGARTIVSRDTWHNLVYPWPGAKEFGQRQESQWYVYWMQSYPGRGNRIPFGGGWMTNWWAFVGDWDAAVRSGLGLYGSQPAAVRGQWGANIPTTAPFRVPEPTGRWPVPEDRTRGWVTPAPLRPGSGRF